MSATQRNFNSSCDMTQEEPIFFLEQIRRVTTAWTGKIADYFVVAKRPMADFKAPHSELAMHTQNAGYRILAFAVWFSKTVEGTQYFNYAQVWLTNNRLLDGLPNEVLPVDIANRITSEKTLMELKDSFWIIPYGEGALSQALAAKEENEDY